MRVIDFVHAFIGWLLSSALTLWVGHGEYDLRQPLDWLLIPHAHAVFISGLLGASFAMVSFRSEQYREGWNRRLIFRYRVPPDRVRPAQALCAGAAVVLLLSLWIAAKPEVIVFVIVTIGGAAIGLVYRAAAMLHSKRPAITSGVVAR